MDATFRKTASSRYLNPLSRLDNVSGVLFGDGLANENVIALYVDGQKGSGWWYEGAGIYRHVHLYVTSKQHIEMDGIFSPATITGPVSSGASPSDGHTADVTINCSLVAVNDDTTAPTTVSARYTLIDLKTGEQVGETTASPVTLPVAPPIGATTSKYLNSTLLISTAKLWSIPRPYLYTLVSELLSEDGQVADVQNTTIGFRSLKYTGDEGFFMNNQHVKVRGFW